MRRLLLALVLLLLPASGAHAQTAATGTIVPSGGVATNEPWPVELVSNEAGAVGTVYVRFRVTNPVPGGGQIVVTFPSVVNEHFGFDGVGATLAGGGVAQETLTPSNPEPDVLVLTRPSTAPALTGASGIVITLRGVKNPPVSTNGVDCWCWTPPFAFETRDQSGAPIDRATGVQGVKLVDARMPAVTLTPASNVAGLTGDLRLDFTTVNGVEPGGWVTVSFPEADGWAFSSGGPTRATFASPVSGESAVGVGRLASDSGNWTQVTFGLPDGTSIPAGGRVSVTLSHVRNPPRAGAAGAVYAVTFVPSAPIEPTIANELTGDGEYGVAPGPTFIRFMLYLPVQPRAASTA